MNTIKRILEGELLTRSEIPTQYTWDLSSVYKSIDSWEEDYKKVSKLLEELQAFKGKICVSAANLLNFLNSRYKLSQILDHLGTYASLYHCEDSAEPIALELVERVASLATEVESRLAFEDPEILQSGINTIEEYIKHEPSLDPYAFSLRELFRLQQHIRTEEVEEIIALSSELCAVPESIYEKLNDTDLKFNALQFANKSKKEIGQGNIEIMLSSTDRTIRKAAYESYSESYVNYENTFAATLSGEVKKATFLAQVRKYNSTLELELDADNIPKSVFDNTIETVRNNYKVWHRYWKIRARALKLRKIAPYDIHAPLTCKPPQIQYEDAVKYVLEGVNCLGEDYGRVLSNGLLQERWVDIYPNKGKRSNAFSAGTYGTPPYLLLNYGGTLSDMSTLAHELGHSMHTYLTNKHQHIANSNYSLFVAEVASNFNQAVVRARLMQIGDRDFKLAVLDETFYNFHRYLFTMPILAQFEKNIHNRIWEGEGLTAKYLNDLMSNLLREGYGEEVDFDSRAIGLTWAQYGHLYAPFYVFQYTTGISAANALAKDVLSGDERYRQAYINLLKAGGSNPPMELLKIAGVDLSTPVPIQKAFAVLEGYIDQLESLI